MVDSKDLGERLAGVSIRRVRAVSMGLSRIDDTVEDAVAIKRFASGAVDVSMELLETTQAGDGIDTSPSCIPRNAAKNDLKNVSIVR